MKKNIISFILGAVIFSSITAYATTGNLIEVFYNVDKIVIDGTVHSLKEKTFIYKDSVYVPLRFVGESLNKKVSWDDKRKTVSIEENSKADVKSEINEDELKLSEKKEKLDLLCKQLANKANSKDIKEVLNDFSKNIKDKSIRNIYLAKETGEMYCEPNIALPQDYNVKERDWYINTKENGEYVSKVYTDFSDNTKCITLAKSIYENEKFIGVVGIDLVVDSEK